MPIKYKSTVSDSIKLWILISTIILTCNRAYSTDSLRLALEYHKASAYDAALPIFIKLSNKFQATKENHNYALCQVKIADILRNYGGVNLALELLSTNGQFLEIRLEESSSLLSENYLVKAEALYTSSRLSEFKDAVQQSIKIKRKLGLPENQFIEDYFQLARYYLAFQNQSDSCYYWITNALKLAKADREVNDYLLPRIYNLLGYHFHPASLAYFTNNLELFKKRLILSRKYYDSAFQFLAKQSLKDELTKSKIYHNLGNSYNNEYSLDTKKETMLTALDYYSKSRSVFQKLGSPTDLALKDWVVARAYERIGLFDSALYQLQIGVNRLIPEFKTLDVTVLPPLQPTLDDARLLTLISLKGNNFFYRYRNNNQLTDLKSAYEHFTFLLKFNHYVISKSVDEQTVTYMNHLYGSNAYQQLIATAYELSQRTQDIRFVTKIYWLIGSGKYAWLLRNDVDPSLRKLELASVIKEESKLVTQNILLICKGLTDDVIASLLPKPIKQKTEAVNNALLLNARASDTTYLKQVQNHLSKEKETLVDYYKFGEELYVAAITSTDFKISKISLPKNFDAQVRYLRTGLLTRRPNEYAHSANTIYRLVLDSIVNSLDEKHNTLVICPDGILQEIAWDALVEDTIHTDTFKEINYLLNSYVMRTVLTPGQLLGTSKEKKNFHGIVANFKDSKRFSEIPFSASLVDKKGSELNGLATTALPASSNDIGILHVTAHVISDSLRPYRSSMFFNDSDSITVGALAKVRLPAQLVILNACQTGKGTYYQSEGTISFSRSFFCAGAQSVLMTLWNVDDKITSELIDNFYASMQHGNRLDVSLKLRKCISIA